MRKCVFAVSIAAIMLTIPITSIAQAKLSIDPNTAVTQAVQRAKDTPDPRLAQKITYDSGYKRLHDVTNDLTRISGVNIICGQNAKDSHVRDLPLVVCVKDMPLGKLLRVVADATHAQLGEEKTSKSDPKKTYRIYHRTADDLANDTYQQSLHEAHIAQAKWVWDAMVTYGKSTEIPGIPTSAWHAARLMASLGPDTWDKLQNGDIIKFTTQDRATEKIFRDLYQSAWQEEASTGQTVEGTPTDDDMDTAVFKFKLVDTDDGWAQVDAYFGPMRMGERSFGHGRITPGEVARLLKEKGMKLPERPADPPRPSLNDTRQIPDMTFLQYKSSGWDNPLLRAKIDLEKPKDIEHPTFADLIRALASATGLNIVTEDFTSHRYWKNQDDNPIPPDGLFNKGTNIADTLMSVHGVGVAYDWFFNENDKLLVGRDFWWNERHKTLPSEAYIDSISRKYAETGLEIDDVIGMICLPPHAFNDWILTQKPFRHFDYAIIGLDPSWRLYGALDPSDKQLVQSADGLSLSKFDTAWIASFFTAQKRKEYLQPEVPLIPELSSEYRDQVKAALGAVNLFRDRAVCDPKVISTMVMRMVKSPAVMYERSPNSYGTPPAALGLSWYRLEISYKIDGELCKQSIPGPDKLAFPMRSPEREAEIIEAAKK